MVQISNIPYSGKFSKGEDIHEFRGTNIKCIKCVHSCVFNIKRLENTTTNCLSICWGSQATVGKVHNKYCSQQKTNKYSHTSTYQTTHDQNKGTVAKSFALNKISLR